MKRVNNDKSTANDSFGVETYADSLIDFIETIVETPFAVSIDGEWGSGKSSFLDIIENNYKQLSPETTIVKFNPWKHRDSNDLLASLSIATEEALIAQHPYIKFIANIRLIHWKKVFTDTFFLVVILAVIFITVIPKLNLEIVSVKQFNFFMLGAYLAIITSVIRLVIDYWETLKIGKLQKTLESYSKKIDLKQNFSFQTSFSLNLKRIIAAFNPKKMVFLLDDVDRCSPEVVFNILSAINFFLATEIDAVFIIAMDKNYVSQSIKSHFNSQGIDINGYDYIDKFIQLSFSIPKASQEGIQRYIESLINENRVPPQIKNKPKLSKISLSDIEGISTTISENSELLSHNPRKIKKVVFSSIFNIHLIHRLAEIYDDTDFQDLSCVQLSHYELLKFSNPVFFSIWNEFGSSFIRDYISNYERAKIVSGFDENSTNSYSLTGQDLTNIQQQNIIEAIKSQLPNEKLYNFLKKHESNDSNSLLRLPVKKLSSILSYANSSWPYAALIFTEVEEKLKKFDSDEPYILDGAVATIAYNMYLDNKSILEIKNAIDKFRKQS